jgi:hypothetical protein
VIIMDPNQALAELRNYRWRVEQALAVGTTPDDLEFLASGLAERVDALDNWIRMGGSLPSAWAV